MARPQRLAAIRAMTLGRFFQLPFAERQALEDRFPDRPKAVGSKPTGITKSSPNRPRTMRDVRALMNYAKQYIFDLVAADNAKLQAAGDETSGSSGSGSSGSGASGGGSQEGGDPADGDPSSGSQGHGTPALTKQNGILLSNGRQVVPEGAAPGLIRRRFPLNVQGAPRGISNSTNLCYRNSLLQCLVHTPAFYNLLGNVHKDCTKRIDQCITCALQQFIQSYWNDGRNQANINRDSNILQNAFKAVLTSEHWIQNDEQDDPYPLMQYLIRYIHWDTHGIDPDTEAGRLNPPKIGREGSRDVSILDLFSVKYDEHWTCSECGEEKPVSQYTEMGFGLDVSQDQRTLLNCIEAQKILDIKNFKCDTQRCSDLFDAGMYPNQTRVRMISQAPAILVVQLRRFTGVWVQDASYDAGGYYDSVKSFQHVEYEEDLNLTDHYAYEDSELKYRLRGVVGHSGYTIDSGHYQAAVLRRDFRNAHTYSIVNDRRVHRPAEDQTVLFDLPGEAYMLIYSKENGPW